MKWMLILLPFMAASTWSNEQPPELWSSIKDLNKSKEACEIQSSYALQSLSLEKRTENKHGIYGNIKSNRVVVKCIAISEGKSKLMVAVAGNNRSSVEMLRNKIVQSIN